MFGMRNVSDVYGLSRSRDRKGNIVKRNLNDVVNCLHASCGGGWEDMWVLVVEVYDEEPEYLSCAFRGRSDGDWFESEHEQRLEIGTDISNSVTSVQKDCLVCEIYEE